MTRLLTVTVAVALVFGHLAAAGAAELHDVFLQPKPGDQPSEDQASQDQWRAEAEGYIAQLGSKQFVVRQRASKALRAMGKRILPLVYKHLRTARSEEAKLRLRQLVDDLSLLSKFGGGLDGWTLLGGRLTHERDAKSGGHLVCKDTESTDMYLKAPSKFTGDLSSFAGGVLQFNLKDLSKPNQRPYPVVGLVLITSTEGEMSRDIVPGQISHSWQTFGIPLDAHAWKTEPKKFERILANVTGIVVYVENSSTAEVVAFDSFRISSSDIWPLTEAAFKASDSNSDGRLNRDEFPADLRTLWGGLDVNADGWVDKAEAGVK